MSISKNYIYPVTGATAPTANQVRKISQVVCDIAFSADADTTTTSIVHNMNLSTDGSDGRPKVTNIATVNGAADFRLILAFVDANTISVTKSGSGTGTTGTVRLWIERPHSITR